MKYGATVFSHKEDIIFSDWHKKGEFCSSVARDVINDSKLSCASFDDWNCIWRCVGHPMQFFYWKPWWDRLAARKNLNSRLHSSPFCFFCLG